MNEKVSKESVNYRQATARGHRCGTCSMFRPQPNSPNRGCTLVRGTIRASDVCDRWEGKR